VPRPRARRLPSGARAPIEPLDGVLVLDKPAGLSSAAAVERVKRALGVGRAGHGGTLDPIATGVLPVCLGEATKLAQYLLADDKAYEAEGVLGAATDTLDRTGRVLAAREPCRDEAALRAAIAARRGEHDQVPPAFSAIKQGGVRMYHRARAGEAVALAPRRVRIDALDLLELAPPRFRVAVACSKGTYIRSLIADLGADLGCGAHLAELRRTRSGRFSIERAVELPALEAAAAAGPAAARAWIGPQLVPLAAATALPVVVVPGPLVARVRAGVQLPAHQLGPLPAEPLDPGAEAPRFQMVDESGVLWAVAHVEAARLVYDRVLGGAPTA
jgi:tRNA pseudouridine55 synthase